MAADRSQLHRPGAASRCGHRRGRAGFGPVSGRALDIGCGAGATSLALACARPRLSVTGIDLSEELIAIAETRLAASRLPDRDADRHVRFHCGDAVECARAEGPADLIVSRHGLMFFTHPVAALTAIRAAASDGAMLVFSCFDDRARNRFATIADEVTGNPAPVADDHDPGPFAFADPDRVRTWLATAGWHDAVGERVAFDYVAGEGDDPVADALSFLSRIGPAARPLAEATSDDRKRMLARLSTALAQHRVGNRVILPASAWIWQANAAAR